jgi:hypothetical protein
MRHTSPNHPAAGKTGKGSVIARLLTVEHHFLGLLQPGRHQPMTTRMVVLVAAMVGSVCLQDSHCSERTNVTLRRFDACPGSKITVRGTSSIHEWRAEGCLISGFLEVPVNFPCAPATAPKEPGIEARGEVFIPVRNLKAVGKTWEPDNEQITLGMHKMLRAQEYPRIGFRLTEPLAPIGRATTATTYAFDATGDLVIAGTTNRVSIQLEVAPLVTNKLRLSGSAKLKQSDFRVIPKPERVFDAWDNDTVEIAFEWMVEQKQNHEAQHATRSN